MPAARPCRNADEGSAGAPEGSSAPLSEAAGAEVFRSAGLDDEQVRAGVAGFRRQAVRCFAGHDEVYGQLVLEFSVGCDGRVRDVQVVDDTVYDPAFASCIADVYRYAPFATHGREEAVFQVPLTFDPPAR